MKKITTVKEIITLAKEGKSVWASHQGYRYPAAFLQNWQARLLQIWIDRGCLYYYEKKEKK